MPQKSGTRCTQDEWQVRPHSVKVSSANITGTGQELTRTFPAVLLPKRQDITAMATPICTHIGEFLEAMRNAVVDLLFVRVRFCIGFAYALRDNAGIAFCVTSVLAILALHACRIFEKISTQRTTHDVVELL